MARKRSPSRKVVTPTSLPPDLHEQLRWLASDLGVPISGLLRWGAILVLQACGEELPDSVAHLRLVPFGGERREDRHEIEPEHLTVCFDDRVYGTVKQLAEQKGLGVERFVHGLVLKGLPADLSVN
jgi:hypothetical protein